MSKNTPNIEVIIDDQAIAPEVDTREMYTFPNIFNLDDSTWSCRASDQAEADKLLAEFLKKLYNQN